MVLFRPSLTPYTLPSTLFSSLSTMTKNNCNQKERRNERERKRVNQVNQGFNKLRARIERISVNKKLSKADTLREAARYIAHLKEILNNGSMLQNTNKTPQEKPSEKVSEESYRSHSPVNYKPFHNQLQQMNYCISHNSR